MNSKLLVLLLVFCLVTSSIEWRRRRRRRKRWFRVRIRLPRIVRTAGTIVKVGTALGLGKRDLEAIRSENEGLKDMTDDELMELMKLTDDDETPGVQ